MTDIDPITGLPKELGVWDDQVKEGQEIKVKIEKKKFGKEYTVVEGINTKEVDIKQISKRLKAKFACGGTYKDGKIELQGNYIKTPDKQAAFREALVELGFAPDTINIK